MASIAYLTRCFSITMKILYFKMRLNLRKKITYKTILEFNTHSSLLLENVRQYENNYSCNYYFLMLSFFFGYFVFRYLEFEMLYKVTHKA